MGSSLSGGQRQRILLARALYRRPRLLFMDEGTSHLDTMIEARVNTAIRGLGLTRIVIAHRPETIASAARRISITNGRLQEDVALPDCGLQRGAISRVVPAADQAQRLAHHA
jgi:ATP-binding cassette subfamily B protein RaxB